MRRPTWLAVLIVGAGLVVGARSARAQLNGTIWQVENFRPPTHVFVSQSAQTVVFAITSFDVTGGPWWAAVVGTIVGNSGSGTFILPLSNQFVTPIGALATFSFSGGRGTFTTEETEGFLSLRSGTLRRVFP
jgi:hypothetical protein